MKQIIFSLFVLLGLAAQAQRYEMVPATSVINWKGDKVTGSHEGTIALKSGWFELKNNKLNGGKVVIDMGSIVCTDLTDAGYAAKLVGHLKSDDFFGVDKFPEATFEVVSSDDLSKGSGIVTGKLTIKGVTQAMSFKANYSVTDGGLKVFGLLEIDRTKFNVRYGSGSFFDNLGDKTIYDNFTLKLNLVSVKK